jgi:hypothetical protein
MRLAISNRIIVKKSQEIKRGQQETLFVFEEQTICIKDNSRSKVFAVEREFYSAGLLWTFHALFSLLYQFSLAFLLF